MYTQCPECLTVYEIAEDALQASLGIVQCGRCNTRFDALRTLSDSLPLAPLTPLPEQDPATHAPTLTQAVPPSAYEAAARKQRSRDAATPDANAGQHQLELAPSAPATQAGDDEPSRTSADDWFADLETELAAAPVAEPSEAEAPAELGGDGGYWAVELPDQPGSEAIGSDAGSPVATTGSDVDPIPGPPESPDGATTPLVGEQPATEPEPDTLDREPDPAVEMTPVEPGASAVVSQQLLEGDVFTQDLIETWIEWKRKNEVDPIRFRPHPHEFEMYYDI